MLVTDWASSIDLMWEIPPVERCLRRLAAVGRLILFDKRGNGASDRLPLEQGQFGATVEQAAGDLLTVLDAAESERAAVVGSTFGGWPALLFAATHPGRCTRLVVQDSPRRGRPDRGAHLRRDVPAARRHRDALLGRRPGRRGDRAVRRLARFRGRLVDRAGDGLLAIFDGPARAVRCAEAICSELRALGLEARAGVHVGEVELRDDKARGVAVHIAARVMSLARPGEVVVSRTVNDLTAGSGLRFTDRGRSSPSMRAVEAFRRPRGSGRRQPRAQEVARCIPRTGQPAQIGVA